MNLKGKKQTKKNKTKYEILDQHESLIPGAIFLLDICNDIKLFNFQYQSDIVRNPSKISPYTLICIFFLYYTITSA